MNYLRLLPPTLARAVAGALFASLAVTTRSAAAYPAFSAAAQVAPPSNVTSGDGEDNNPSIATDGTDFLVVWSVGGAIRCARVTAGDVLLDKPEIQLSLTGANPQAFWDGTKYLVISSGRAARIDPATGAADPAFTLQGALAPSVAAVGGGAIFDVWQAADGTLQGGIYDLTGTETSATIALPSGPVSAPTNLGTDYESPPNWGVAAVAASPGQFLVGWITTGMAVEGARVSAAGVLADTTPLAIVGGGDAGTPPAAASINVAGSPTQYLVSWISGTFPYDHDYSARVSPAGVVADPGGVYMNGPFGYLGMPPAAAWDGAEWWIADTGGDSYTLGQTLGLTGAPSAPVEYDFVVSAIGANPAARLAASDFDLVITGAGVTTSGAGSISASFSVATQPSAQTPLCTTASSTGYLVVWSEAQSQVYGLRFGLDGTPIDPAPFALGAYAGNACAALGGTYYFGGEDLDGTATLRGDVQSFPTTGALTISKNVVALAPDAGAGSNGEDPLALSCASDHCLLLSSGANTVWGTIFGAGGNVIVPPIALTSGTTSGTVVAANDGSTFLVSLSEGVVVLTASGAQNSPFLPVPALAFASGAAGTFLGAGAPGLTWFNEQGTALGTEALPSSASAVAWDGTAFFVAVGEDGAEIPATPYNPDAGGPPIATYPLFADNVISAASDGAGHVMALAVMPTGPFATRVLFARFGVQAPNVPDAGVDGGTGDGGSPSEAGSPGPNDASTDDAGPATDAADAAGPDAADAAPFPLDGSTPSGDSGSDAGGGGSPDATIGGSGESAGCGCRTAGTGFGYAGAWIAVAGLALLGARRRRRPRSTRDVCVSNVS